MAAAVHSAMSMDSPQPSRSPNLLPGEIALCQVDGCNADLSGHKEYYRRHRVCEMHAKAVQVTVGNETQRFCQQCSRFHMLDSFDEGKRSCRRRLLGHNRRRRKQSQNADSWPAIRTDGVQTPDSLRRLNSVHDAQQDSKRLRLSSGQGMGMGSPDSMTRITGNLDTMGPKGGDIPIGSFSTPAGLQQLTPGGRSGSNYGAAVPSLSPSELSLLLPQRPSGNPQIVNQAVQPVTSILLRQAAQLQTAPQAVVQVGSTPVRNLATGPYLGLLTSGGESGFNQSPNGSPSSLEKSTSQGLLSRPTVPPFPLPHSLPHPSNSHGERVGSEDFVGSGECQGSAEPSVSGEFVGDAPNGSEGKREVGREVGEETECGEVKGEVVSPLPQRQRSSSDETSERASTWPKEAEGVPPVSDPMRLGLSLNSTEFPSGDNPPRHFPLRQHPGEEGALRNPSLDDTPAVSQQREHWLGLGSGLEHIGGEGGGGESLALEIRMKAEQAGGRNSSGPPVYSRQDRTGRVSLKLFDRKPEDLPANLKEQVNEWLGKSPLLMENFVREGCTVVSFIMRLSSAEWTKVSANLQESLERLVCGSGAEFWGSGGILVQWETQMAFIREGKVQEVPVPLSRQPPMILSVKPFCVAAGKRALLTLSGFNLCPPDAQAVCYVGGKAHTSSPQKVQRTPSRSFGEHGGSDLEKGKEELNLGERAFREMEEVQIVMPVVEGLCGRVFVEVEHLIGPCSSNIWPVLVADKDVCNDIATLERFLDSDSSSTTGGPPETQIPSTVELLHDLGWALQELNQLKSELAAKEGEDLSANETVSPSRGECYHLPDPALEALIQLCISRGLWEITKRLLDLAVERRKLV